MEKKNISQKIHWSIIVKKWDFAILINWWQVIDWMTIMKRISVLGTWCTWIFFHETLLWRRWNNRHSNNVPLINFHHSNSHFWHYSLYTERDMIDTIVEWGSRFNPANIQLIFVCAELWTHCVLKISYQHNHRFLWIPTVQMGNLSMLRNASEVPMYLIAG